MDKLAEDMKAVVPDQVLEENPNFLRENQMMFIKRIILPILDKNWREHIDDMDGFRQGIYLQSYAQTNPLELYQREGYKKFERLNKKMNEEIDDIVNMANTGKLNIRGKGEAEENKIRIFISSYFF